LTSPKHETRKGHKYHVGGLFWLGYGVARYDNECVSPLLLALPRRLGIPSKNIGRMGPNGDPFIPGRQLQTAPLESLELESLDVSIQEEQLSNHTP
jgi:hypothetical protein